MTSVQSKLLAAYEANHYDSDRIEIILRNRYAMPMYKVFNWIDEGGDPEIEYYGLSLEKATEAMNEAGRVSGFEDRDQNWIISTEDTQGEIIEDCVGSRYIPAINNETDMILSDVKAHFGGKYTSHSISDDESIKLRIADHSGKHRNCIGTKYISIVIAEKNPTKHFTQGPEGMGNEYYFDSSYTAEDIIKEVTTLLLEEGVAPESI